jgi:hemoglobin
MDSGSPMLTERLFGETAREVCPPAAADHFIERARRIAQSLEMGVAVSQGVLLPRGDRFRRPDAEVATDDT